MNRANSVVECLGRQGIVADLGGAESPFAEELATVRLRFDRVALRFIRDMQTALQGAVPDGKVLVFAITAPLRLASKTAAALDGKIRSSLARGSLRTNLDEAINGNRIRIRLLAGNSGAAKVIGFVHNPDTDPDVLFRATQKSLDVIGPRPAGKTKRASMTEVKRMRTSALKTTASKAGAPEKGKSPSQLIDARIRELGDWRGEMLGRLRALVKEADPQVVETWKWRGVPVWEHDGIICTGETYKSVVKMTFARGAALKDPSHLFNSSLDGNVRRAIDFHEGDKINEKALKDLVRAAVALNAAKGKK